MNLYVVVEGQVGEMEVYNSWIPLANPALTRVESIAEASENHFYLIAGMGFPNYYDVIKDAIADVATHSAFDRLVIAVDSEDMTYAEKRVEICDFLGENPCRVPVYLIVQHFCLEAWALAIVGSLSENPKAISYAAT